MKHEREEKMGRENSEGTGIKDRLGCMAGVRRGELICVGWQVTTDLIQVNCVISYGRYSC